MSLQARTRMSATRRHFASIGLVAGLLFGAVPAYADTKEECSAAGEQSKVLRHDGHLKQAREQLLVCARPACPRTVHLECTAALAELEHVLPSVVLHVVDRSGADLTDVHVSLDGQPLVSTLDGKDIPNRSGGPHAPLRARGESPGQSNRRHPRGRAAPRRVRHRSRPRQPRSPMGRTLPLFGKSCGVLTRPPSSSSASARLASAWARTSGSRVFQTVPAWPPRAARATRAIRPP